MKLKIIWALLLTGVGLKTPRRKLLLKAATPYAGPLVVESRVGVEWLNATALWRAPLRSGWAWDVTE